MRDEQPLLVLPAALPTTGRHTAYSPGPESSKTGKRCDQPVLDNCLTFVTRILPNPSLAIAVSGCSVFFHWYLPLQQFCQVRNVQMESKKADIAKNKHPVTMAELLVAHIQP